MTNRSKLVAQVEREWHCRTCDHLWTSASPQSEIDHCPVCGEADLHSRPL